MFLFTGQTHIWIALSLQSEWASSTLIICCPTCQQKRRTCEKCWRVGLNYRKITIDEFFRDVLSLELALISLSYLYLSFSEPFNESPLLEIVQSHSSSASSQLGTSSGIQKRKYSMAFLEANPENSQNPPPLLYSSKKPFLANQGHRASSVYASEVLSQNPHTGPGHSRLLDTSAHHMVGLGSSSSHHSGTIFPSSHFSSVGASQQAVYEGRKVLMCTCCSRAPAACARPPYPASDTFPSVTSQEFAPHAPLPASQPLQHFPMRGLMETSHTARHAEFYGLYGQSSTKHYGTK